MCTDSVVGSAPQLVNDTVMYTVLDADDKVVCPRLPPEVWDRIIDFVAGAFFNRDDTGMLSPPSQWRRDLHACSLVCHTFLPRSLLQLYEEVELRSAAHLTQIVHTLSNSPILRDRVDTLIVNAKDGTNQSWVSLVPIRLQIRTLLNCRVLVLRGVDLSTMHSHAKTAFTCLGQRLSGVTLEDVHYFSSLQLARFFRIAKNVVLRYSLHNGVKSREVAGLGCLPPCPIGKDRFRGEDRYFTLEMSWATLAQVTQDWDLSTCSGDWDISLGILGDVQDTTGCATALANIVKVAEGVCRQPFWKSNIRMRIAPALETLPLHIWLCRGERFPAFVSAFSAILNIVGVKTMMPVEWISKRN